MKTCNTHVLSWIRPPPEFNETLSQQIVIFIRKETRNPISSASEAKKQTRVKHSDFKENFLKAQI